MAGASKYSMALLLILIVAEVGRLLARDPTLRLILDLLLLGGVTFVVIHLDRFWRTKIKKRVEEKIEPHTVSIAGSLRDLAGPRETSESAACGRVSSSQAGCLPRRACSPCEVTHGDKVQYEQSSW